jgi:membrane protein implicated in regulation of membrane protease activity
MILAYWHWVIFGLAMMAAELMVPGAFFLWVGIAALMLGVTTFIFPFMAVPGQLVLFGVLAPLAAIIGRKVMRNLPGRAEPSLLNRRGQQLAGETITLDVPIINGHAHVTVGDSKWHVKGPDLPAGMTVKVVGIEGNMLIVVGQDGSTLNH